MTYNKRHLVLFASLTIGITILFSVSGLVEFFQVSPDSTITTNQTASKVPLASNVKTNETLNELAEMCFRGSINVTNYETCKVFFDKLSKEKHTPHQNKMDPCNYSEINDTNHPTTICYYYNQFLNNCLPTYNATSTCHPFVRIVTDAGYIFSADAKPTLVYMPDNTNDSNANDSNTNSNNECCILWYSFTFGQHLIVYVDVDDVLPGDTYTEQQVQEYLGTTRPITIEYVKFIPGKEYDRDSLYDVERRARLGSEFVPLIDPNYELPFDFVEDDPRYMRTITNDAPRPCCPAWDWELFGDHLIVYDNVHEDAFPYRSVYAESDVQEFLGTTRPVTIAYLLHAEEWDVKSIAPFVETDTAYTTNKIVDSVLNILDLLPSFFNTTHTNKIVDSVLNSSNECCMLWDTFRFGSDLIVYVNLDDVQPSTTYTEQQIQEFLGTLRPIIIEYIKYATPKDDDYERPFEFVEKNILYKRTVNNKKFSNPPCCVSDWELSGEHLIVYEKFYDGYPFKQRYTESDVQDYIASSRPVTIAHLFNSYVMEGSKAPFLERDSAYMIEGKFPNTKCSSHSEYLRGACFLD